MATLTPISSVMLRGCCMIWVGTACSAWCHFDLKYLISAVVEMGLAKVGISRRFNRETLTPQGDMRGHTESRGEEYRRYVQSLSQAGPSEALLHKRFQGEIVLENFLKWAKQHNIRVIGTLPTVFNDRPISDKLIAKIASLYRRQGQEFLLLPNHSQYDRHCFYDTDYTKVAEPDCPLPANCQVFTAPVGISTCR